jgi:hypothetical protein
MVQNRRVVLVTEQNFKIETSGSSLKEAFVRRENSRRRGKEKVVPSRLFVAFSFCRERWKKKRKKKRKEKGRWWEGKEKRGRGERKIFFCTDVEEVSHPSKMVICSLLFWLLYILVYLEFSSQIKKTTGEEIDSLS